MAVEFEQASVVPGARDVTAEVDRAKRRLAALPGIHRRFGVVRLWPELSVAEHENVERFRRAAELMGAEVVTLDGFGGIVDQGRRPVTNDDVDFVLHLHYLTSKSYEPISVAVLWNPLQWYVDFGFDRHWANQMSHDVFASAGSEQIRALLVAERGEAVAASMPPLTNTLADPILLPIEKSRYFVFYCGIGWERTYKRATRHEDFLKALDKSGRLHLYGPQLNQGVRVWDGFDSYRGAIPFDGHTIVRRAWDAGAALVFSSAAHKASKIMSNRLFESVAAGAVVLGDDNPVIRDVIGENYVAIPMDLSPAKATQHVVEILADFDKNPGRAVAMASAAQARLIDSHFLCDQIAGLFEAAEDVKKRRRAALSLTTEHATAVLDIVLQALDRSASEVSDFVAHLRSAFGQVVKIIIIARSSLEAELRRLVSITVVVVPEFSATRFLSISSMLEAVRPHLAAQKIMFTLGLERFYGHAALSAIGEFGLSPVGRLSYVIRSVDTVGKDHRDYISGGRAYEADDLALASYVFDSRWLMEKVPLPELSHRGIARLAARLGHDLPVCYPSALQVDLPDYERLLTAGYRWYDWRGFEAGMIDRVAARQSSESADVTTFSANDLLPVATSNIALQVFSALRALPESERLDLARSLFNALPLPGWIKRGVLAARRRLGRR